MSLGDDWLDRIRKGVAGFKGVGITNEDPRLRLLRQGFVQSPSSAPPQGQILQQPHVTEVPLGGLAATLLK